MDIDGIDIGATGCLLMVVVLVNEPINSLNVQEPVQYGVEKVVNDKERHQSKHSVGGRKLLDVPIYTRFKVGKTKVKVNKGCCRSLAEANKDLICGSKAIEMLATDGNLLGVNPFCVFPERESIKKAFA